MKLITNILIVLTSINFAYSQLDKKTVIYSSGELNLGNYTGIDINLNYIHKETYSFKIGYTKNVRKPKSQPDDYTSSLTGLLSFGLEKPYDNLQNYHIGFGKIYNMNKKGTIRANISLGLGYTTIKEPENWQLIDDAFLTENYTWTYRKHNTVSIIINPKIEFPFTRFYGLTISPMLEINKDRTYIGIGIGQIIGLLRNK